MLRGLRRKITANANPSLGWNLSSMQWSYDDFEEVVVVGGVV